MTTLEFDINQLEERITDILDVILKLHDLLEIMNKHLKNHEYRLDILERTGETDD